MVCLRVLKFLIHFRKAGNVRGNPKHSRSSIHSWKCYASVKRDCYNLLDETPITFNIRMKVQCFQVFSSFFSGSFSRSRFLHPIAGDDCTDREAH